MTPPEKLSLEDQPAVIQMLFSGVMPAVRGAAHTIASSSDGFSYTEMLCAAEGVCRMLEQGNSLGDLVLGLDALAELGTRLRLDSVRGVIGNVLDFCSIYHEQWEVPRDAAVSAGADAIRKMAPKRNRLSLLNLFIDELNSRNALTHLIMLNVLPEAGYNGGSAVRATLGLMADWDREVRSTARETFLKIAPKTHSLYKLVESDSPYHLFEGYMKGGNLTQLDLLRMVAVVGALRGSEWSVEIVQGLAEAGELTPARVRKHYNTAIEGGYSDDGAEEVREVSIRMSSLATILGRAGQKRSARGLPAYKGYRSFGPKRRGPPPPPSQAQINKLAYRLDNKVSA